ncbi:hypothetical protein [Streptomyces virginiae]|uniref:hypothetical protein n=1 Tax=Streptomyces virginiae TaxID=1961 RepID=UPI0022511CB6|nr:hypothetical protein [Streptomyces virginiae]MCX5175543.1 hypothetical protein [Streptomyces virginiae]
MGRQKMRRKVYAPLRRAGLEVIEGGVPEHALPAFVIGAVVSCGPGTGRRDAYLDYDAPRLVERANQGWYELASDFGLFGADREFLLALPAHCYGAQAASRHRRHVWRRVRLLDDWDVMGAACAIDLGPSAHGYPEYILGAGAGHPGFGMLSLDSSVAVVGTTWQTGITSLAVPDPGGKEVVRAMLEGAATREWDPREEWFMGAPRAKRAEALAWLRHHGWTGTPQVAPEPIGWVLRHLPVES